MTEPDKTSKTSNSSSSEELQTRHAAIAKGAPAPRPEKRTFSGGRAEKKG